MNPSASSATEVPNEGSPAPADARALTLHLEVCRMQTELEVLERRIDQYEQAEATGVGPHDPFAERAEDLVQRMIDSLYAIGRSEILESTEATQADAEEVVEAGRRRAREILVAARLELAEVLTERAEAVDAARALAHDVVDLTTRDDAGPLVAPVRDAAAAPVVDEPLDDPVGATAVEAGTVPEELEASEVVDEASLDVVTPESEPEDLAGSTETETEAEPETETEAEPDEATTPAGTEPAAAAQTVEPEDVVLPPPGDVAIFPAPEVASTPEHDLAPLAPPEPATAPMGPVAFAPPEAEPEVQPWAPPAPPAPPTGDLSSAPAPTAAQAESQRTDDAFDAWLAVAPPPRTEVEGEVDEALPYDTPSPRPGWVRPLEGAVALLAVALLVVLALLVIG